MIFAQSKRIAELRLLKEDFLTLSKTFPYPIDHCINHWFLTLFRKHMVSPWNLDYFLWLKIHIPFQRIGSSVVALFSSISEDDIRCLERVELRNCGIPSNREVDYALRELIENIPQKLSVFDLRQNPILDNDTRLLSIARKD